MHLETRPLLPLSLGFCISPYFSGCPAQDPGPRPTSQGTCASTLRMSCSDWPPFQTCLCWPFWGSLLVPRGTSLKPVLYHKTEGPSSGPTTFQVFAMWQALFWLSFQLESGILEIQMNTSISGGMEGKDVCIEVFFFLCDFFLFNVQTNKYFFMKKMCRLHFTFCILCVCVSVFWCL